MERQAHTDLIGFLPLWPNNLIQFAHNILQIGSGYQYAPALLSREKPMASGNGLQIHPVCPRFRTVWAWVANMHRLY
jgi:hypothetical protein